MPATYTTAHGNAGSVTHWVRDWTHNLMIPSQICFHCTTTGTPWPPLLFVCFMAAPVAQGSSQTRDWIHTTVANYTTAVATVDPLTHCARPGMEPTPPEWPKPLQLILYPLHHSRNSWTLLLELAQSTNCFESGRFTFLTTCLVYGFNTENVACPALQPVNCVMVLFDVGHNHPAIHGVTQACNVGKNKDVKVIVRG